MKRIVIMALLVSNLAIAVGQKAFDQRFRLLPRPQQVDLLVGEGLKTNQLTSVKLIGITKKPVVGDMLAHLPLTETNERNTLTLELTIDSTPVSREGYMLEIVNGKARITSRGEAGLFYGCQTLNQLLQDSRDLHIDVPSVKITDFPELPYRAVHLDLKYHVDAVKYYYDLMDRFAEIKINAVIIEFEDKLRYRTAPVVAHPNAISIDEFATISKYAGERNIEVTPLVQGLGHAAYILKHEQYKDLRDDPKSDYVFDPLNPKTYELQFSLYMDAMEATPGSKYLHVGGDEVYNLGMSELSKKSGKKPFELQMYWLNKVSEFARKHNRVPIFWDDMLFSLSGLYQTMRDPRPVDEVEDIWSKNEYKLSKNIALFPKDVIYMRWTYWQPEILGNIKAIEWFKSHNFKVMAATAAQDMAALLPRNSSNYDAIAGFSKIAIEKKMDGIVCTGWDVTAYHFETFLRGICDFASVSWNYQDQRPETAHADFRHRFYAPELAGTAYDFQNQLERALKFWDSGFMDQVGVPPLDRGRGLRLHYPKDPKLMDLPSPNSKGEWARKYAEKITRATIALTLYDSITQAIRTSKMLARRNMYSLEIMEQINELQVYPAKMIQLLAAYDASVSPATRQKNLDHIAGYLKTFSSIRDNFERVFSKTRFLGNPNGYVSDQNTGSMLAGGTVNNDWMFVYELAMNKKIGDWIKANQ